MKKQKKTIRVELPNNDQGIPYKCPVCGGTGKVPCGFYEPYMPNDTIVKNPFGEICRSCGGTGIVWGKPINIEEDEDK